MQCFGPGSDHLRKYGSVGIEQNMTIEPKSWLYEIAPPLMFLYRVYIILKEKSYGLCTRIWTSMQASNQIKNADLDLGGLG